MIPGEGGVHRRGRLKVFVSMEDGMALVQRTLYHRRSRYGRQKKHEAFDYIQSSLPFPPSPVVLFVLRV